MSARDRGPHADDVNRALPTAAIVASQLASISPALAYRPFDSTDADVARAGEFELELGPAGALREGSGRFVLAPAVVANLGFSSDRELVIEGVRQVALDREPGEARSARAGDVPIRELRLGLTWAFSLSGKP